MSMSVSAPPLRPPRSWYLLATALVVGAVAWVAVELLLGYGSLRHEIDGFQRAQIPGQTQLSFAKPGGYVIYYEAPGASAEGAVVPSVVVNLVRGDGSGPVQLQLYHGQVTYDLSGHEGRAVATFQVDQPGGYLLEATGTPPAPASLAVGRSIAGAITGVVLRSLLGGLALFLGGVGLAVAVALRRRRARRAALAATAAMAAQVQGWQP
jgi:hypothetical protein